MWWWRTMPGSEPSPARRATRLARPGADSTVSLAIPSRPRTAARNFAPSISYAVFCLKKKKKQYHHPELRGDETCATETPTPLSEWAGNDGDYERLCGSQDRQRL